MSSVELAVKELNLLTDDEASQAIIQVLKSRPELAVPVVIASCPDLTYAPAKACNERREVGIIKSFNTKKGYGFIESQGVRAVFAADAFIHKRQMVAGFAVGQQVTFCIMLNEESKPQAFDLQAVGASTPAPGPGPMPGGPMPMQVPFMPMRPAMGMPFHPAVGPGLLMHGGPPPVMAGLGGPAGPLPAQGHRQLPPGFDRRRFRGVLKGMSSGGFGFVECAETRQVFDKDIFVPASEARDCTVGHEVTFSVIINMKGNPQATDVKAVGGADSTSGAGAKRRISPFARGAARNKPMLPPVAKSAGAARPSKRPAPAEPAADDDDGNAAADAPVAQRTPSGRPVFTGGTKRPRA